MEHADLRSYARINKSGCDGSNLRWTAIFILDKDTFRSVKRAFRAESDRRSVFTKFAPALSTGVAAKRCDRRQEEMTAARCSVAVAWGNLTALTNEPELNCGYDLGY
jgi:hypothetical protein